MKICLQLPDSGEHPNRVPFSGCLTMVDAPSDKSPSGARGHRVILTREAALEAMPGLIGMAIDYRAGWDGHDARQKVGIITAAELDGQGLMVSGFVYGRDFPEMAQKAERRGELGMSYELADAVVIDMRASVWTLTRAHFTGAAVLDRCKAAYRGTSFEMESQRVVAEDQDALALAGVLD